VWRRGFVPDHRLGRGVATGVGLEGLIPTSGDNPIRHDLEVAISATTKASNARPSAARKYSLHERARRRRDIM
jgi:hypothetical protein